MLPDEPAVCKFAFTHFTYLETDRKWRANCGSCKQSITETMNVSTSFIRHLKRKHPTKYGDYEKHMQSSKQGGKDESQPSVTSFLHLTSSSSGKYGSHHPDQVRKSMSFVTNCIVTCGIPMSVVDKPEFVKFIADMDPKFHLPSRYQITEKFLPELVKEVNVAVSRIIDKAAHVALTMDIWTDRRTHAYLATIAHIFIECIPESFLLAFQNFSGSHTGVRIAEKVETVLALFKLSNKVSGIVTDNASNMRKAIEVLSDLVADSDSDNDNPSRVINEPVDDDTVWQDLDPTDELEVINFLQSQNMARFSCFAHSLQLVVKDGLVAVSSSSVLSKCSALATLIHHSALFKSSFEQVFGSGRSISVANVTRWNSLLRQLESVAGYDQEKMKSLLFETEHGNLVLSSREQSMLNELIDILQPLAEATDRAQGESVSARISCVVPIILALHKFLSAQQTTVQYHSYLVQKLLSSLEKRFKGLLTRVQVILGTCESDDSFGSIMYPISTVLDPEFGFLWLQHDHPGPDSTKNAVRQAITAAVIQHAESVSANIRPVQNPNTSNVTNAAACSESAPQNFSDANDSSSAKRNRSSLFASYSRDNNRMDRQQTAAVSLSALVTSYMDAVAMSRVKTWTDVHSHGFAELQPLFEKLFSITATSAPVERIFSHGGLFIRPHRARMSDKTLCDLVFVKCNRHLICRK